MTDRDVSAPMIDSTFLNHAGVELKRAERYRIFVSLVVVDLSGLKQLLGELPAAEIENLMAAVRAHIRASDIASLTDDASLALLFPETSRQGAEAAGRRLTEMVRRHFAGRSDQIADQVIPMEMASYPDAAGARSLAAFLEELAHTHRN